MPPPPPPRATQLIPCSSGDSGGARAWVGRPWCLPAVALLPPAAASLATAGLGICHAVGHPLSALLGKAHGQTLATMLPHVMRFNMAARADKYARVAQAFGVHDAALSDAG